MKRVVASVWIAMLAGRIEPSGHNYSMKDFHKRSLLSV